MDRVASRYADGVWPVARFERSVERGLRREARGEADLEDRRVGAVRVAELALRLGDAEAVDVVGVGHAEAGVEDVRQRALVQSVPSRPANVPSVRSGSRYSRSASTTLRTRSPWSARSASAIP